MGKRKLELIASAFRDAIERILDDSRFELTNMNYFPNGCCNYVSEFLMKYLFEEYNIETFQVYGRYGYGWDSESHSWLETTSGIIIDITGDQYVTSNILPYKSKVYVGKLDDFHNMFDIENERDGYESIIDYNSEDRLSKAKRNDYKKILQYIKNW